MISEPELALRMSNSNREKSHSEGSNRQIYEPVRTVLHSVQRQILGNVATNLLRSDELLAYPEKIPQRGGNSEIIQWMESTIIQASNQEEKGIPFQKERGRQERNPSSFYQQASSQPTSPRGEEEQEKVLEETIFPRLQDPKNPKRCHGKCLQHGQNLDGIQGQRGKKEETTSFPKEITLSFDVVNNLTEIKNSILPLEDIKSSLSSLQEIKNSLSALTKTVVQNKKEIDNMKFMVENNKPKILIDNTQKLIQGQQELYKYIKDIEGKTLTINYDRDKSREPFKPNTPSSNEQIKCHKFGGIEHLVNNCLKKANISEIVETGDHNDKEEESDSEKDTEDSEPSESDKINIINAQINNVDSIYEVLDVNSNLPQVGTSDTSLTNTQDAKLYINKPTKGMGYTAGNSSISIFMVGKEEAKVNFDIGAYCTCAGKGYLNSIVPDWEEKLIPIQGVKFSSASERMKTLGIIELTLIFPHPPQCIRVKVEFVAMENCTSNPFILGNDYLSIYGIDISNQKDRYLTIGENKSKTFGF
ncbi:hypothetical protein O181_043824 [Austropuccinia psidii MF-1]|uniref:Uncharacterized protein n=1 Tax=Austropuccinia psidii MF-1 TaxID=1389203 RepID=A0A9Q3DIV1_9BASI|nr:hypothetical protein [Austropuccinia psidii MF-1]